MNPCSLHDPCPPDAVHLSVLRLLHVWRRRWHQQAVWQALGSCQSLIQGTTPFQRLWRDWSCSWRLMILNFQVHQVASIQKSPAASADSTCYRCGMVSHLPSKCRHKDAKYFHYGKGGYLARVCCRKAQMDRQPPWEVQIREEPMEVPGEEYELHHLLLPTNGNPYTSF